MPQILDSLELLIEAHHLIKEEVLLVINSRTICDKLIVGTHCLLVLFFWPMFSPQLSLSLFTEAGTKSLFLCLVPSSDHSLSLWFLSTSQHPHTQIWPSILFDLLPARRNHKHTDINWISHSLFSLVNSKHWHAFLSTALLLGRD